MKMESLPPAPSCKPPPQHPLTSISCRRNSCNSACKMGARETARLLSTIPYIRPSRSSLRNDLGRWKTASGPLLDSTRECFRDHAPKHHSRCPIPGSKGRSTEIHRSKLLHHISPIRNQAALPACRQWFKPNHSTRQLDLNACRQRHRRPSHLVPRLLGPRPHHPNRSMEAGSTRPRMEINRICPTCRTLVARVNLLVPL